MSLDQAKRMQQLYEALKWAMPLAEQALEDCRQLRLRAGHTDIKAGDVIGLWPDEVAKRDEARKLLTPSQT